MCSRGCADEVREAVSATAAAIRAFAEDLNRFCHLQAVWRFCAVGAGGAGYGTRRSADERIAADAPLRRQWMEQT